MERADSNVTAISDPTCADAADEAYEVRREAVAAMLEHERRSFTSSLLALALLAAGIAFLPDPELMYAFLAARALSFAFTRWSAGRLEILVRQRKPLVWAQRRLVLAMAGTGFTLGLLLWPQPDHAPDAARIMVFLTVVIAVTLIPVTLAALPAARDAMLASFLATVIGLILLVPGLTDTLLPVMVMMVVGIRMYAANAGRHIVNSASILVENKRLSEDLASALAHAEFLGSRDPLTGLLNRRSLFEDRAEFAQGIARHVLTIDLDHFKAINDRYGHAAGDHVLIAAADTIRALIAALPGNGHRAFRLGGEEFAIIFSGIDTATAHAAAEALRGRIATLADEIGKKHPGIAVTASVGFAEWFPDEDLDEVLLRSDMACYRAKNEGRDRVAAA